MLKSAPLACRRTLKSALLARCSALKVPFSWEIYHAFFGGWGKHYVRHFFSIHWKVYIQILLLIWTIKYNTLEYSLNKC